jgi:NodT family efflux transporter outer membrane factor (OMF) lipoprotein
MIPIEQDLRFMMRMFALVTGAALLGACTVTKPPASPEAALPAAWYAPPLPHQGRTGALAAWWSQFDDPVLIQWIERAQAQSPSIAAARAQVFGARAAVAGAESAAGPQAALVASAARGRSSDTVPLGTSFSAGAQASWAVDLWGQAAAGTAQARAQQDAAQAGWHEARVLVAAETARLYFGQRLCRAQLAVSTSDRDSRAATADSSAVTERAGLLAPAVAALARASSAESAARTQQQAEQCERQVKALVALTAVPEPELRAQLAAAPGLPVQDRLRSMLAVSAVPAEVIRQRPDVFRAQRDLVAASEGVGVARGALLPSLTLSGSVLRNRFTASGGSATFNTWSVGPLTLSLPVLGRGALSANADAALARYDAAGQAYAATLRGAVAEVEQALVTLSGLQQRVASTDTAVAGYTQSFTATEARHRVGLASLNELEEARRLKLNADSSAVALLQERINAWISLYVALGGGFDPLDPNAHKTTP